MTFLSNILALASFALYTRCKSVFPAQTLENETINLLDKLSYTFTEETRNSASYLYFLYKSKPELANVVGFGGEEWQKLENSVDDLINGDFKTTISLASLLYSFSIYSNIDQVNQEFFVNRLNYAINSGKSLSYIPYSKIDQIYSGFSLTKLNDEIAKSPKDTDSRLVNYNWYNSESLFSDPASNPSLTELIKDSENQYYYLSGEIIYDLNVNSSKCKKNTIKIQTLNGEIETDIYEQLPCFEEDSFVGPVTGIKFYRIFNDGPPSSGYFDSGTMNAYIDFDKKISDPSDYSSNKKNIYSFYRDDSGNYIYLKNGFQIDAQGAISPFGEYGIGHTNVITDVEGCRWTKEDLETLPLMRMHQGDDTPKYHYYKIKVNNDCETGIYGPFNWTGWKFANFELKDFWLDYFDYININPRLEKNRILKRALNIENYSEEINNETVIHSPYLNVVEQLNESGTLFCNNYVGYPQLDANYSTLPGFAFYQTFDNLNFGTGEEKDEYLTINIHPAFSKSSSSMVNTDSNRAIEVSSFAIFTGKSNSHGSIYDRLTFIINKKINSSSLSGYDEAFKKSLAIGDNFSGQVSGYSSPQYNAGYYYTGYTIFKDGEQVSLGSLIAEYEDKKISAKYSKIKFLTGYFDTGTEKFYPIVPITAHISNKSSEEKIKEASEYIVYYYLNTETGEGSIMSLNSGWNQSFAPIPKGVEEDNEGRYSGLYSYQKVENYFPRYYSGPYATYENKFLYPNADFIYKNSNITQNGFPYKISYVINVREETVRELFGSSGISAGFRYENVVRASSTAGGTGLGITMVDPFVADSESSEVKDKYNYISNTGFYPSYPFSNTRIDNGFYYYSTIGESLKEFSNSNKWVNANYIPSLSGCLRDDLNEDSIYIGDTPFLDGTNRITRIFPDDEFFSGSFNQYSLKDYSINQPNVFFVNGIKLNKKLSNKTINSSSPIDNSILQVNKSYTQRRLSDQIYYWLYQFNQLSGEMLYVPPIFDLSVPDLKISQNFKNIFSGKIPAKFGINFSNNGLINYDKLSLSADNDSQSIINKALGKDPIFVEYIGGRSGEGSEFEGGYHNQGIIGDNWYGYNTRNKNNPSAYNPPDNMFLLALETGNLNIYTRGLSFFPYYHNWENKKFTNSPIPEGQIQNLSQVQIDDSEYYYNFNLKDYFPFKNINSLSLYSLSGLTIGPFSEDIELCVLSGNYIIPSGKIIVDERILTSDSVFDFPEGIADGIDTEDPFNPIPVKYENINTLHVTSGNIIPGTNGRNPNITTFKLVPKGKTVNINISGNTGIGFVDDAIVTIRPRKCVAGTLLYNYKGYSRLKDFENLFGDHGYLDIYNFVNNGTEQKFSFSTDGNFSSLIGKTFEYVTEPFIETLFPIPNSDFDDVLGLNGLFYIDNLGNKNYLVDNPTFYYWSIVNNDLICPVFREVSRISFEIKEIKIDYGEIPYQSHKIVIPSGDCTISGIFGYTGQAESAVISQGIFLSGEVGARVLTGIINPYYVSDVLKRLPSGIEILPSGSGINPVLDAPSYMKIRENYFYITGGDKYIKATPSISLNYNKFIWPALSDLALLNPDVVYEQLPPDDGTIFPNNYIHFSASQGQIISSGISGKQNPIENVNYKVNYLYAFIDSIATNAIYNTGQCIFKTFGTKQYLDSGDLTGILISDKTPLSLRFLT